MTGFIVLFLSTGRSLSGIAGGTFVWGCSTENLPSSIAGGAFVWGCSTEKLSLSIAGGAFQQGCSTEMFLSSISGGTLARNGSTEEFLSSISGGILARNSSTEEFLLSIAGGALDRNGSTEMIVSRITGGAAGLAPIRVPICWLSRWLWVPNQMLLTYLPEHLSDAVMKHQVCRAFHLGFPFVDDHEVLAVVHVRQLGRGPDLQRSAANDQTVR